MNIFPHPRKAIHFSGGRTLHINFQPVAPHNQTSSTAIREFAQHLDKNVLYYIIIYEHYNNIYYYCVYVA